MDHIPAEVLEKYSLQDKKVKNMIYLSKEEIPSCEGMTKGSSAGMKK
jgi:hypothetical protein